ncbi:MAG: antibiotic biosynthesis monooxygenase [Vicinamibacterales bacterium]
MIKRIWRGWTTEAHANDYERLLRERIFPDIAAMQIPGYQGIVLLRRPSPPDEVEFMTVMTFSSIEDVRAFAGEAYETAHVPDVARRVLTRWDATSAHYELRVEA